MQERDERPLGSGADAAHEPEAGGLQSIAGRLQGIHQETEVVNPLSPLFQESADRRVLFGGLQKLDPSFTPAFRNASAALATTLFMESSK